MSSSGSRGVAHRRTWTLFVAALCAVLGIAAQSAGAAPDSTAVRLGGNPLSVYVGPRGQCQSSYTVNGTVRGNYFPGGGEAFKFSPVGDCGLILAFPKGGSGQPTPLADKTYGFAGNAPAVDFAQTFEPLSQSAVSGDGSSTNPFSQTTIFSVVDSGAKEDARITETTTYVSGSPQFTSSYAVKNTSGSQLYFRAIYAGDLFAPDAELGTGLFLSGPPRFIGGQSAASGVLGGLLEAPSPALPWSSFEELAYPEIWTRIKASDEEAQAFKGNTEAKEVDDAVGVEWDQLRTAGLAPEAEGTFSVVNRTLAPSDISIQPTAQTRAVAQTATVAIKALDTAGTPYVDRSVVYSIAGANPKAGSVTTDASGVATISYVGTAAGLDVMHTFVDLNGSGSPDAGEPAATGQITWTPLAPTPLVPNSRYRIQSVRASSGGTVTIVLVPVQDGTAVVEVTVPTATISRGAALAKHRCKHNQTTIKGRCRPKITLSGKLAARGKAGATLRLIVKPSNKVKKALAKGKAVQLTAKLTYKAKLGGKPTVQTFHLRVKPKRPKKKTH
ncbi:MAG: Ig-like domain-containing protein [Solirubrobacteraceae bacterium]